MEAEQVTIVEEYNRNGGYCECGCGQKTKIQTKNDFNAGLISGKPARFIQSHNMRLHGEKSISWNGGTFISSQGYVLVKNDEHPRRTANGYVPEQILVVESIIGKFLPYGAVVHHINGDKSDNINTNLVLCQDWSYHMLLHMRTRAFRECGHADWRKCRYCHKYDEIKNMHMQVRNNRSSPDFRHRSCETEYLRQRRMLRRGEL